MKFLGIDFSFGAKAAGSGGESSVPDWVSAETPSKSPPVGETLGNGNDLIVEDVAVRGKADASLFFSDDMRLIGPRVAINTRSFNGEKTAGNLGNPTLLIPDYQALRVRAHQANFTSDIIKIITGKFFNWVVGAGLKLQAQPNEELLGYEGVAGDQKVFRKNVEAYFEVYANSTMADYANMQTLQELEIDAYTASFLGGDCLIVLRIGDDLELKVQVIDGQHIRSPLIGSPFYNKAKANKNIIVHGIELDQKGEHVAFYVVTFSPNNPLGVVERIEARGKKSGQLMAWMIYGKKQRIDHKRGIPQISSIIETAQKLDRFTEASVGKAEEIAKNAWFIEHNQHSDGENPMIGDIKRTLGGKVVDTQSSFEMAEVISKNITATEGQTTWNMPIGSTMKSLNNGSQADFDPFWQAVFVQLSASQDMPPEVALQKYNSNYSASRAANGGWEHLVDLKRKKHGNDFKQKIYNVWLYLHVLKRKVEAPGYVQALDAKNRYVTEAYSMAKFTGTKMPNIDPVKEANAVRILLGNPVLGQTPLITHEQATEQVGYGDWAENYKKYLDEESSIVQPPAETEDTTKIQINE